MDFDDPREIDRAIGEQFSDFRASDDWRPDVQRGLDLLRRQDRRRRPHWSWLAAGALAACIPIVALPATRSVAERAVSACVTETLAVRRALFGGSANATAQSTFIQPADRKPSPDFALRDANGHPVRLSDFRGELVLLSFSATTCEPCQQVNAWLAEFQSAYEPHGFTVLGVSMDGIPAEHAGYPVVLGNDEVRQRFAADKLPLTLLIDRSGRIAAIHAGLCRKDEYEADINAVLKEMQK